MTTRENRLPLFEQYSFQNAISSHNKIKVKMLKGRGIMRYVVLFSLLKAAIWLQRTTLYIILYCILCYDLMHMQYAWPLLDLR